MRYLRWRIFTVFRKPCYVGGGIFKGQDLGITIDLCNTVFVAGNTKVYIGIFAYFSTVIRNVEVILIIADKAYGINKSILLKGKG